LPSEDDCAAPSLHSPSGDIEVTNAIAQSLPEDYIAQWHYAQEFIADKQLLGDFVVALQYARRTRRRICSKVWDGARNATAA
jgi:hypothetical protein